MTIRAAPTPSPASAPATIVVNTARLRHNVVILASPSRRKTGLLQRQVTRALDSIDGDDSHAQAPPAADDDDSNSSSSSSGGGGTATGSGVTVQSPSARKMRVGGAANGHVVYQISPNAVKRKRSHSMANVPGAAQPHGEVEDLRVSIDLIDKNATGSRKRSGKSREGCGRVTPSKRCGGKDKKKPKVDVIERALKRFRANRHHDADRSFEFTSVCNLSAHDDAFGDSTPVASQRRGRSDSSCCNGNVDQSAEGSESTLVRVQVGVSCAQGARAYMEDRYSVTARLFEESEDGDDDDDELQSPASLLAVYDGHNGPLAAEYASHRFRELLSDNAFLRELCRRPPYYRLRADEVEKVQEVLRDAFAAVDEEVLELTMGENKRDGSTVLLGLLIAGKLFIANLGDSRGVWGTADGEVERISVDHKPDLEEETKRIEEAGGKVIFSGCWRVAHDEIPLRLAVSRSLGDHPLKVNLPVTCSAPLVSVVPDIQVLDISGVDDVLVFATDGLWDRVSDEDAIDIVRARFDDYRQANAVEPSSTSMMQFAADALVERALAKRSMDNITAMVIGFSPFSRDLFREDAAPDGAIRI
ncbi:hypothetical protein ATCC90586_006408 [Pythium insidiosum]|nr:hypothetical protein ATCC90586_006408 [Pythium insidiosum]